VRGRWVTKRVSRTIGSSVEAELIGAGVKARRQIDKYKPGAELWRQRNVSIVNLN